MARPRSCVRPVSKQGCFGEISWKPSRKYESLVYKQNVYYPVNVYEYDQELPRFEQKYSRC